MLLLLLLTALGATTPCSDAISPAEPILLERAHGHVLGCLDVAIDGTVTPGAVERALRVSLGDTLDVEAWRRDLQALRNSGIFRSIEAEVLRLDAESVDLRLHVRTAYSLLPFLAYEGGAVPIAIIGGHYANLFGEMVDLGGYYMRRGPYNLGRAWLGLPNLVMPRSLLELQLVMTGELRPHYAGNWRLPNAGVEVTKRGGFADFGWQPLPDLLTLSLRCAFLEETTVPIGNMPDVIGSDAELARGAESVASLATVSLTLILGQIDLIDNFLFRGHELRAVLLGASSVIGSDRDFAWLYLAYRGFQPLARNLDVAARGTVAHSTSRNANDDFILGGYNLEPFVYDTQYPGLLTVRGIPPGQFQGRELAFANVELRYTALPDLELWLIGGAGLQIAAFVDTGRAWTGSVNRLDAYALVGGAGVLVTLLDFYSTYLNWYVARVFEPVPDVAFNVILTRPFL